jgi:hypothetical protein
MAPYDDGGSTRLDAPGTDPGLREPIPNPEPIPAPEPMPNPAPVPVPGPDPDPPPPSPQPTPAPEPEPEPQREPSPAPPLASASTDGGTRSEGDRCPVCGVGRLRDLAHDADPDQQQGPGSREVQTFTCGHEVVGDRLDSADAGRLHAERRESQDTVEPPPER